MRAVGIHFKGMAADPDDILKAIPIARIRELGMTSAQALTPFVDS